MHFNILTAFLNYIPKIKSSAIHAFFLPAHPVAGEARNNNRTKRKDGLVFFFRVGARQSRLYDYQQQAAAEIVMWTTVTLFVLQGL